MPRSCAGNGRRSRVAQQRETAEPLPAQDLGTLLNAVTFVFFGAAFIKPLIERATWQDGVYALLSLTVVRMVPVAIALLGTRSRPPTVMYLGWFGPRGLASIVFAVLVVEANVPHDATIVDAAVMTVIASIVLHGLTAGPLTDRYTRWLGRQPPAARHRRRRDEAARPGCSPLAGHTKTLRRRGQGPAGAGAPSKATDPLFERERAAAVTLQAVSDRAL